jgi:hypothetical protein
MRGKGVARLGPTGLDRSHKEEQPHDNSTTTPASENEDTLEFVSSAGDRIIVALTDEERRQI